ncbi:hypothetical protein [Kitasatospora sp. DSM 101779]|uniref:hypothetical protein n=1 Tax=Kitasatospora sp. DSM 101779 TaxID=2853165 RepID=UPI0021D97CAA|nr:hypothetical protein [Kitasatospora sp. DSM 101779]MCU7821906.1 hypothetical protein [Kitasatospora sp. DSM 101779]
MLTAVLRGIGLGLLVIVVVVGGTVAWLLRPGADEYPSRTADARLARLAEDPLLDALAAALGSTAAPQTWPCRDTPHGRMPPELVADYTGPRAELTPQRLRDLAAETGWRHETTTGGGSWTSYALTKSFDGWRSRATVTVEASAVQVVLDASEDDRCP